MYRLISRVGLARVIMALLAAYPFLGDEVILFILNYKNKYNN